MSTIKVTDADEAVRQNRELLRELGIDEVAIVRNLDFIPCPFDFYPLFPKAELPLTQVRGIAVDMDGTSTTTEPLALHSLEYMVRKFSGRMSKSQWKGLDERSDYPYIIGNSNFRHTEFLLEAYGKDVEENAFRAAFFEALFWTQAHGTDERRKEIKQNAINCGLSEVLTHPVFLQSNESMPLDPELVAERIKPALDMFGGHFSPASHSARVAAALDIYYTRYHYLLQEIGCGRGADLSKQLLGGDEKNLIGPMPGLGIFISLVKGWLGSEAEKMVPLLKKLYTQTTSGPERLGEASARFEACPVKLSLVTASIFYEAHTVMTEVFRIMKNDIDGWPVSENRKQMLRDRFSDYQNTFDAFVTATDASEARLKPHRDLYSNALYQMSIPRADYQNCMAFEDTSPGIIAARAAGFGVAVALPNHDTKLQDYTAASVIASGLPEVMLRHNIFI